MKFDNSMRSFLILGFLILPGWLFASDLDNSIEVTIHSGFSFAEDTLEGTFPCANPGSPVCLPAILEFRHTVDNSLLFGVGLGYFINREIEIEGNFSIAPTHNFTQSRNFTPLLLEHNVITYTYDVNLVYNFDWKGTRPYLTAGIGGITRDSFSVTNDFTYNFGVGSKFHYKNIGFRLELNDHIISDYFQLHTKTHNVQIQTGVFFGF